MRLTQLLMNIILPIFFKKTTVKIHKRG